MQALDLKAQKGLIDKMWQDANYKKIDTPFGKIACVTLLKENAIKNIVFVTGRTETYLKYGELFFDLQQCGFNVYSFDHIGQGLSDRLTENKAIGHIVDFNDYVICFDKFVSQFVDKNKEFYLLAHSMGCGVSTLFLKNYEHSFRKACFCSPMLRINIPVPKFSKLLAIIGSKFNPRFVLNISSSGKVGDKEFKGNLLTSSIDRYNFCFDVTKNNPTTIIGRPSYHWVKTVLEYEKDFINATITCPIPLLILEAMDDKIVILPRELEDNLNENSKLVKMKGSRHEILVEIDPIRNAALRHIVNFLC